MALNRLFENFTLSQAKTNSEGVEIWKTSYFIVICVISENI